MWSAIRWVWSFNRRSVVKFLKGSVVNPLRWVWSFNRRSVVKFLKGSVVNPLR